MFLSNYSLKFKLYALATICVICLASYSIFSFSVLKEVKVTGPIYLDIITSKDLIADILPPPEYIVESYLILFELAGASDEASRSAFKNRLQLLQKEYQDRHAYWDANLKDEGMRQLLLQEMHAPATSFFKTMESQFMPALQAGDKERMNALLYGELHTQFATHREAVDKLVDKATAQVNTIEQRTNQTLQNTSTALLGFATLIALACYGMATIIISSIVKPMSTLREYATHVAKGDLNKESTLNQRDEIGNVAASVYVMVQNLKAKIAESDQKSAIANQESKRANEAMQASEGLRIEAQRSQASVMTAVEGLQEVVHSVANSSRALSDQVERSQRGAQTQSERIAETATAMEQMNATVLEVAQNASNAAESSQEASSKAKIGADAVDRVVLGISNARSQALKLKDDMESLGKEAEGIGQIMSVIRDIADQTNLLALNAAIEAARAGDAGRGFAVVADEVRKLAEKTMEATKRVGDAVDGIQKGTTSSKYSVEEAVSAIESATELANHSGQALSEIVGLVERASDQVRSIASASVQQSAASEEINRSIDEVNNISTQTAAGMHESAQVVIQLDEEASTLRELIAGLRAPRGSAY